MHHMLPLSVSGLPGCPDTCFDHPHALLTLPLVVDAFGLFFCSSRRKQLTVNCEINNCEINNYMSGSNVVHLTYILSQAVACLLF